VAAIRTEVTAPLVVLLLMLQDSPLRSTTLLVKFGAVAAAVAAAAPALRAGLPTAAVAAAADLARSLAAADLPAKTR
jgi:hypothetical protein